MLRGQGFRAAVQGQLDIAKAAAGPGELATAFAGQLSSPLNRLGVAAPKTLEARA
jgi:hypothetical protein